MNKAGCLVIHGFGGNVTEVEPLVLRLKEAGFQPMAPNLKGHTGRRQDLVDVSYTEWIDSAESALLALRSECKNVYIIGFSMGGLIALHLVVKYPICGLVTINTPIYYWNAKRVIINLTSDVRKGDFANIGRYLKSSNQLPPEALLNFQLLLSKTKPKLKEVRCPILITQAINDDAVQKSSADYIYNRVVSEIKQLKFYDSSEHLILWSPEANAVINDTIEFLQKMGKTGDRP